MGRAFNAKKFKRTIRRTKKVVKNKRRSNNIANLRKFVQAQLNRNIETKSSQYSATDGIEILHNNFVVLSNTLLYTGQGIADSETSQFSNRIGDTVMCKGVSLKMMLEMNERYNSVTFRLFVVNSARGDVPTRSTLFNNLSGNKMLDTINYERYSVLLSKTILMKNSMGSNATATGTTTEVNGGVISGPAGIQYGQVNFGVSRHTKIVSAWIPGAKFGRGGKLIYDAGGNTVKFFDYTVLLFAYSNYGTRQDEWNVGRVNDFYSRMIFTDA